MSLPIDHKPETPRKPVEVAADCAKRGETEAAKTILNLLERIRFLERSSQPNEPLPFTEVLADGELTPGNVEWFR